jgi:hypothetical protein
VLLTLEVNASSSGHEGLLARVARNRGRKVRVKCFHSASGVSWWRAWLAAFVVLAASACGGPSRHKVTSSVRPAAAPSEPAGPTGIPRIAGLTQPPFEIAARGASPTLPFTVGIEFHVRTGAAAITLPDRYVVGCTAEIAVRSPDGRYVLFTGLAHGTPVLRLLDLATRSTVIWRQNACDPAWSHDDQIAYLRLTGRYDPQGLHPTRGRVYVQGGLDGRPVRWSSLTLEPLAWAGRQLLARSVGQTRLFALTARASAREITGLFADSQSGAYDYGRQVSLVALNPAGTLGLLDLKEPVDGYARDEAGLLDLADDQLVARKLLPNIQQVLNSDGYWTGQTVITSGGVYGGFSNHPPPVLVELEVIGRHIRVKFERGIDSRVRSLAPDLLSQVGAPRYVGSGDNLIGAWLEDVGDTRFVECSTTTLTCSSGQRYRPDNTEPTGFISNPSRP